MTTLPLRIDPRPTIRVVTKPAWSVGGWTEQPISSASPTLGHPGFELISLSRRALPGIGRAVLRFVYGEINGKYFGVQEIGGIQKNWTPDLWRHEVRILGKDNAGTWRTMWWGTVEQQIDTAVMPGSVIPAGAREYHCEDGFSGRAQRWPVLTHGCYTSGATPVQFGTAVGHPGYNLMRFDGRIAGNREASGAVFNPYPADSGFPTAHNFYHDFPGSGASFSDLQAAESILLTARPSGDVAFLFAGNTALLSGASVWPVSLSETAWTFINKVCKRQRGRGNVFCDWLEPSGYGGAFTPQLTIRAQHSDDIVYTPPQAGATPITLAGAKSAGSTCVVALQGDHRLGSDAASSFQLGDRAGNSCDYLETVGECIEVAITHSYQDHLVGDVTKSISEELWKASEATAFAAANVIDRRQPRWDGVYQLHGLRKSWDGSVGDGNNGTLTRADYRCDDKGVILTPKITDVSDTSPLTIELLRDLPLYRDYNYGVSPPVRYDAQTTDLNPPERRTPVLLVWQANNRFRPLEGAISATQFQISGISYKIDHNGFKVFSANDAGTGSRMIGDPAISGLGSSISYKNLVFTVGIRLPHRLRFASGDASAGAARKRRIYLPKHHLWLAHQNCIYDLDTTTGNGTGFLAKRGAAGAVAATPGILRDDRAAVMQQHMLAWAWYGTVHRTAQWKLACCGLLPTATTGTDASPVQTTLPQIGQVVLNLAANGQQFPLQTPITDIVYDHQAGETTWSTDWSDLDFVEGGF